jgi:hypothetical protein
MYIKEGSCNTGICCLPILKCGTGEACETGMAMTPINPSAVCSQGRLPTGNKCTLLDYQGEGMGIGICCQSSGILGSLLKIFRG